MDRELVGNCIQMIADGDDRGLEIIYAEIGARMFSVALGILKNRSWAEEAVQDSFIKIVQNASRYKSGTNGYAWICMLVRNISLNILKRETGRKNENIEDFYDISAPNGDVDEKIDFKRALSQLDYEYRKALYLRYYLDFTVREVASAMKIPRSNAERLLKNGEKQMKELLK